MFQMVDEGDDKYIMLTDPELCKVTGRCQHHYHRELYVSGG